VHSLLKKSFPCHVDPYCGIDLHLFSSQPDNSLCSKTMDMGASASCSVPVHSPSLLVLTAPTHQGMARLSLPGWPVTCQDGSSDSRHIPILVLKGQTVTENYTDRDPCVTINPHHHWLKSYNPFWATSVQRWSPFQWSSARQQPKLQVHEHKASVSRGVPV